MVLIGSLARGDYTAFSDADVVIVLREDGRRPMDRIPDFLDSSFPIDLEPGSTRWRSSERWRAPGSPRRSPAAYSWPETPRPSAKP
ncbi:nucleotidyltransferase domain-containing protein [Pyrobaculum islandicum]|uniref:nucleotidyltransferase domain-containing protein n=1 Tax=Pyrobaculum islandicum TaxID=2277 RepID=UPI001FD7BF36|nr:nucleotidyltransferase domain-containing protein [Pyrobaculum islandicum]